MKFDLMLQGGRAVLPGTGTTACSILVRGGQIAGIVGPDETVAAEETLDVGGLLILPGVIDAHVHFGLGSPTDWQTESAAAAIGGVTTVLNYIQDPGSYLESSVGEVDRASHDSVIDFGLHFILMNERHLSEIPDYVRLGVPSFKYFTNFKGTEGQYIGVEGTDGGFFFALCQRLADYPTSVLVVHTENIEVVWRLAAELKAAGRDDLAAWNESRPDLVESLDMQMAFAIAERTGCHIYIPHVSSELALNSFRTHRAKGGKSVLETCPHYLTHTSDSPLGSLGKVNPPLRTARDVEALWEGLRDGLISVVGSDHNSRPRARKAGSIWTASAGFPGVTTLLPVLLSEGYNKGRLSLERIAEVLGEAPAKIFGLYPQKGSIRIGADADFTVVDLGRETIVDPATLGSHADYSIYERSPLRGWPVLTIVRGTVVMREGEVIAPSGHGRFIQRPVMARQDALTEQGTLHA